MHHLAACASRWCHGCSIPGCGDHDSGKSVDAGAKPVGAADGCHEPGALIRLLLIEKTPQPAKRIVDISTVRLS
jgi:hypothetical protein